VTARRRLALWGPVVLYMAIIFGSSSIREPGLPGALPDKALHGFVYAGLGLLFLRGFAQGSLDRVRLGSVVAAVGATTLYGLIDEVHQQWVPPRTFEVADIVADLTGAAIATTVALGWSIIARRGRSARHPGV
jgi:VanZ family protein